MGDTVIEVAEGSLGAGKTYWAVTRILEQLAVGGHVFTNIEMVWDGVLAYCLERWGVEPNREQLHTLTQDQVRDFVKHIAAGSAGAPVLVVLDEIHLEFNSRDWAKVQREVLEFLTQARKFDVAMILLSQDVMNIDKQFRRMLQYRWVFRDLQKLRLPVVSWLPLMSQACWDARNAKILVRHRWVRKNVRVFESYVSKAKVREFGLERLEKMSVQRKRRTPLMRFVRWTNRLAWCAVVSGSGLLAAGWLSPEKKPAAEVAAAAEASAGVKVEVGPVEPLREIRGWAVIKNETQYAAYRNGVFEGWFPVTDPSKIYAHGLEHNGEPYAYTRKLFDR